MGTKKAYLKFLAMLFISMFAMYAISYLNCDVAEDFRWSETRLYMNLMMGSAMSIVMLLFMKDMYANRKINTAIYFSSGIIFMMSLVLVRNQILIHDIAYMRGMIPHHSIAILTSEHARIRDQRVRDLADDIANSQRREIKEMTWLVNDIKINGPAQSPEDAFKRKIPEFYSKPSDISQR